MPTKFAYIILAHKNPEQVANLVHLVHHLDDHIFIHIDKKSDENQFIDAIHGHKLSNIHFVQKRENGQWGGFGIVQATLNAIEEIAHSNLDFSHVHLLSGQDLPIKPIEEIRAFFSVHADNDFIEFESFPVKHLSGGGWNRLNHYSYTFRGKRLTYIPKSMENSLNSKGKLINALLGIMEFFLPKRTCPNQADPYYGSQWWSLRGETIKLIHIYCQQNNKFLKYHHHTLLPDELFFQTLVLHLVDKSTIVNDNKRFIRWEAGSSHPVNLESVHFSDLMKSNDYFARKFEPSNALLFNELKNEL
jgi:hypothetical protein